MFGRVFYPHEDVTRPNPEKSVTFVTFGFQTPTRMPQIQVCSEPQKTLILLAYGGHLTHMSRKWFLGCRLALQKPSYESGGLNGKGSGNGSFPCRNERSGFKTEGFEKRTKWARSNSEAPSLSAKNHISKDAGITLHFLRPAIQKHPQGLFQLPKKPFGQK